METRPPGLSDAGVAAAVSRGWGVTDPEVAHLPVGFGSHHWSVRVADGRRWIASLDAAPEGSEVHARLQAALTAATVARESGLAFVVAPLRTAAGRVTHHVDATYALALYPHVAGQPGSFHARHDLTSARGLVERLAVLHTATSDLLDRGARPSVDDLRVPGRTTLLAGRDGTWSGPYGPHLQSVLRSHASTVEAALRAHDEALSDAGDQHDRLVVTHGEPHPGNLIRTPDGLVLVDWDTTRLAPPERDVWHVLARLEPEDARDVTALYAERTGRPLEPALVERYRLAWALTDVAGFVEVLRQTPEETADTATAWESLVGTLEERAARHTSPNSGRIVGH